MDVARSTSGDQTLSDKLHLTFVRDWLDKASKSLLATKLRENPSLCYSEFMAGLAREFGHSQLQNRRNLWRKSSIDPHGGEGELGAISKSPSKTSSKG